MVRLLQRATGDIPQDGHLQSQLNSQHMPRFGTLVPERGCGERDCGERDCRRIKLSAFGRSEKGNFPREARQMLREKWFACALWWGEPAARFGSISGMFPFLNVYFHLSRRLRGKNTAPYTNESASPGSCTSRHS